MRTTLFLILLLAGCAAPNSGLSPEQIVAAAKAKDANVSCTKASTTFLGDVTTVYVNLDKGVIGNGAVQVSGSTCDVTILNRE